MKTSTLLLICFFSIYFSQNNFAQITKLANNINPDYSITLNNKALVFNDSLYVTDGTPAGTKKLNTNVVGSFDAVVFKNKIYFAGRTSGKGNELWKSDCTSDGTQLVKDINPGTSGSGLNNFFVFNNTLFFWARNATSGMELWKSDGTASGTVMLKDINPGAASAIDDNTETFFYPVGNILYFEANDGKHGNELWKTNGTAAGTSLVKDITAGSASTLIYLFSTLNNEFVFSANNGNTKGLKLWTSDGTSANTKAFTTIYPDSTNTYLYITNFSKFQGKLIFALSGYFFNSSTFQFIPVSELWSTNATSSGTKSFKDIPADKHFGESGFGLGFPIINNKFYFVTYSGKGNQLWKSDATTSGTNVIKNIGDTFYQAQEHIPVIITSFLAPNWDSANRINFNGKLFMAIDDITHGYEPWITDGTSSGTTLVKDINKKGSSFALSTSETNSVFSSIYSKQGLYFFANDSITGNELWFSDGTSAGTKQLADIYKGKKSSNGEFINILNNHLLLSADDGDNSKGKFDLYKVDKTFDTLTFAKPEDAVAVNIAPDGTSFSVYPNPAKSQLNVSLEKNLTAKNITLFITDVKGRQVYQQEINNVPGVSTYSINISNLAQGVYYLGILTEKGMVSTKFIKAN